MELLVTILIAGIIFAFAIPGFQHIRMHWAFAAAAEDVQQMVDRARWRSINSGEATELVLAGNTLRILDEDTDALLSSVDLADNGVTATAANFPVTFDARGFIGSGTPPTLTIANSMISASRVLTINPVGRIS
jgi:Tfp pilus assembly protein FimT